MTQILDFFQSTFQNEFQTTMTGDRISIGLLGSFFLCLFLLLVYRITYQGVAYSKNFAFSLLLLAMVTSVVIMTVTTNLALSLGMVGALSIVRFRTAVKDPSDTVFMFWAITIGIMSGAGLVYVSIIANVCLGALYLLFFFCSKKASQAPYLLVIRYERAQGEQVEAALASLSNLRVKSKLVKGRSIELCLETKMTPRLLSAVEAIGEIPGVLDVSAVSYGAETTL